jgi:hypothetical protein
MRIWVFIIPLIGKRLLTIFKYLIKITNIRIVELSRLVDESVNFTIWCGSDIRPGRFFGNSESLDAIPADWDGAALHQTCVGKIILANMSNEDRKKCFRTKLVGKTP